MADKEMEDFERTLREIRDAWAAKLPERLQEIRDALAQCLAKPGDADRLALLQRRLHTLSGAAGSFGYAALGMRATEQELQLNACLAGDGPDFSTVAAGIAAMLDHADTRQAPPGAG